MGKFRELFLAEMSHDFQPGETVLTKHHGTGKVHALDGKHNLIVAVKNGEEEKHYQVPHNQVERGN